MADVELTVTVPDQYVARVEEAYDPNDELNSAQTKALIENLWRQEVKDHVKSYEYNKEKDLINITEIEVN